MNKEELAEHIKELAIESCRDSVKNMRKATDYKTGFIDGFKAGQKFEAKSQWTRLIAQSKRV